MKLQVVWRGITAIALATSPLAMTASAHAAPNTHSSASSPVKPGIGGGFKRLSHVHVIGSKCGKHVIASADGPGGTTLRIDQTHSAGTVLSKNISASKGVISAGVGWDVTKSKSITVSGAREVPKGKHGTLDAYTKYQVKRFNVQVLMVDTFVTIQKNKTASEPIGVCFKYHQR